MNNRCNFFKSIGGPRGWKVLNVSSQWCWNEIWFIFRFDKKKMASLGGLPKRCCCCQFWSIGRKQHLCSHPGTCELLYSSASPSYHTSPSCPIFPYLLTSPSYRYPSPRWRIPELYYTSGTSLSGRSRQPIGDERLHLWRHIAMTSHTSLSELWLYSVVLAGQ